MNMKSAMIKVLLLLLCLSMVIPFAACGQTTEDPADTSANTNAGDVTESVTENQPYVEKTNYGEEFTAVYCSDIFQKGYFFVDPDNRDEGNELDDKIYEREILVEEYLGVEISPIDGGNYLEYTTSFKTSVSSGDDDYQMLMTHTYMDVANLITGNYLYDMGELDESINLEADYWNSDLMEDLSINGAMYLGYNDFCLSQCYVVAFNKTMYEPFSPTMGSLYDFVDNNEWTLDKMISVAALVDEKGDSSTKNYGFSTYAWVPLVSFMTSSDLKVVDKDADGELVVTAKGSNNEKLIALHEKIYNLCKADYTYCWGPDGYPVWPGITGGALNLDSNRCLMNLTSNFGLVTLKGEDIKFGVLPYPKYDTAQEKYKSLSWNGVLAVASSIQNIEMVGDVMEMLAWYTTPVKTAFYETLLGSKVANAPEDAKMLDIIWDSVVSDIGLVFCNSSEQMNALVYAIPMNISYKDNKEIASYLSSNARTAQRSLDGLFTEK